jgi:predicted site-specific integrase-resolvase
VLTLLKDTSMTRLVVEHQDRLTRFGFRYLQTLPEAQGRRVEVVNLAENDLAENDKEDLFPAPCAGAVRLRGPAG